MLRSLSSAAGADFELTYCRLSDMMIGFLHDAAEKLKILEYRGFHYSVRTSRAQFPVRNECKICQKFVYSYTIREAKMKNHKPRIIKETKIKHKKALNR